MKKILFSIFIILLLVCPLVVADGAILVYDEDMWRLGIENQQFAVINYEDGFENMLISVDITDDIHGEKAVWIFPVPSNPDMIVIDILKGYPRFNGKDIDSQYNEAVNLVERFTTFYSLFPLSIIPFFSINTLFRGYESLGLADGDVIVHERIEKIGLTSELITTKDQAALNQYLQNKGLEFPQDSQIFDEYIGQDYSFVVSYVSNLTQFKQEAQINERYGWNEIEIGVSVKFPTEDIYFPLKPTSVYGSQEIPILIYVVGHVTPELYPGIKQQTKVTYFIDSWYTPETELQSFFNGKEEIENLKYTKIKINAPSKYLTEDLWIENSAPISVSIKSFLARIAWLWGIILFVILSMISSLLAGLVSFRRDPLPRKKLILHGLWNCLTFIGFLIATILMKTRQTNNKSQESDGTSRDYRKVLYIFLFYVFFIVLVMVSSRSLIFIF
ncbi:MAG: hypothetical protein PWR30_383 [Candidatus Woesearchaeota archaeon]|nr:hypothetical protein [Candidatus Woesearchaeota archaeon]